MMVNSSFIRFDNETDKSFIIEVSKRTQEYFKSTGQSPFANRKWWAKAATVILLMVGSYTLMITQIVGSGWFYILMMTILSVSGVMLGKDFIMLFSSEIGDQKNLKHPPSEVILLIISKLIYTIYGLVIPLLVLNLPVETIIFGFWVSHMLASLFAVMILAPTHLVDETVFPEPEGKVLDTNWSIHQVNCTSDFAVSSPIVSWIGGGLNLHLVHHLCPAICHIHYRPLTKIVKEVAENHNLNYKSNSWGKAIVSHFKFLSRMGKEVNPYNKY